MAALTGAVRRFWQLDHPPTPPKVERPLRFGILGAANIAPIALVTPAKSHPEVVIQAVAARDPARARAFAQRHGIPEVKSSYQDILDDPEITCVYVPLPTGKHFEWAARALKAGKHVLLEKPSTANAAEAAALFGHPALSRSPIGAAAGGPPPPVLLEAVHYRFHPAWAAFMSRVDPPNVATAWSAVWAPLGIVGDDDIRFRYELAGGFLLDCGAYTAAVLRQVFGAEAEACVECEATPSARDARCDGAFRARYRFPNGGVGEIEGSSRTYTRVSPDIDVTHRPVAVGAAEAAEAGVAVADGQEVLRTRRVFFKTFARPAHLHHIQVDDEFVLREKGSGGQGSNIKTWKKSETVKAYTFRDIGVDQPGEPYWQSYRYMLEQFVNKVQGRQAQQWIEHEESIQTARMIDMAYEAANLPLRPTSTYS